MAGKQEFLKIVDEAVSAFPDNNICRVADSGDLKMEQYHAILLMIFHQTFHGPSTFALAGANCDPRWHHARDYLLHHAAEERSHWQWVINDLQNTGYTGPSPLELFPKPACQAYVAFNTYTAMRAPIARLAIATVLESIGATHGKNYATKLCQILKLKPNQAVFFFGHGDTDVGHTADLLKIIDACDLSERDWDWMNHAARTAGRLYREMYDEALEC